MRSHCALYVDAGYLLAAAATRLTGTSLRKGITVDHDLLITALIAHAEQQSGLPLLRVHWYDAGHNGVPDSTQEPIATLPRVKLRLGRIGYDGEQKGVDLRIGLDLVAHARNGAIDAMYLVSGDDDLAEAVEEAQAQGAQVTLLAVPTAGGGAHGMSKHLHRSSDGLDLIATTTLDAAVTRATRTEPAAAVSRLLTPTPPAPAAQSAPPRAVPSPATLARSLTRPPHETPARPDRPAAPETPAQLTPTPVGAEIVYSGATNGHVVIAPEYDADIETTIQHVADRVRTTWMATASPEQRAQLTAGRPSIPRDLDRALLLDASAALNIYDLDEVIRQQLRARFWQNIDDSDHS